MAEKIICKIYDIPKIVVRFGEQGLRGASGTNTDHALLTNLGYEESNHVGFQKQLTYVEAYKCYEVEDN